VHTQRLNSADCARLVDNSTLGPFHVWVVATIALAAVADGYDTFAMAAIAPLLRREWQLSPSVLGGIFSAALIGGMFGALVSPWLARATSRRAALIGSLLWFAAGSAASPLAADGRAMLVARLVTGVGLGMTMPLLWTILADSLPGRVRGRALSSVAAGLPVGGLIAGFASATFLPRLGWRPTFCLGALLPLAAVPLAWFSIEEPISELVRRGASMERLTRTLRRMGIDVSEGGGLQGSQAPAVAFPASAPGASAAHPGGGASAFAVILAASAITSTLTYGLANWIPTLLSGLGMSLAASAASEGFLTGGALGSVLIVGYIVDRVGAGAVTSVSFGAAALVLLSVSSLGGRTVPLQGAVFAIGFFVGAAQFGVTYLYSTHFSDSFRLVAVSFGVIASRAGAIAGPIVPGYLLNAHWRTSALFELAAGAATLLAGTILLARRFTTRAIRPSPCLSAAGELHRSAGAAARQDSA
jgi:MFS transporter, AAHS family, 4-hydroxybenzoate transporter